MTEFSIVLLAVSQRPQPAGRRTGTDTLRDQLSASEATGHRATLWHLPDLQAPGDPFVHHALPRGAERLEVNQPIVC